MTILSRQCRLNLIRKGISLDIPVGKVPPKRLPPVTWCGLTLERGQWARVCKITETRFNQRVRRWGICERTFTPKTEIKLQQNKDHAKFMEGNTFGRQ